MFCLVEYIDANGLQILAEDIILLFQRQDLKKTEITRLKFIKEYVAAIDEAYSTPIFEEGQSRRYLKCSYSTLTGTKGRLFCKSRAGPLWGAKKPSYVCIQGMPRCIRPYLLGQHARDIDCENCHVSILYQMASRYYMIPGSSQSLPRIPALAFLFKNRPAFFKHIESFHEFKCQEYEGEWKDKCKALVLRILYGGKYDTWANENGVPASRRSQLLKKLEKEMCSIQKRIVFSKEYEDFYRRECKKKKNQFEREEVIRRKAFALILQTKECNILIAMKEKLEEMGWKVLSLVFDGLVLENKNGIDIEFGEVEAAVLSKTGFIMRIVEKPLFSKKIEPLSLLK